MNLFLFCAMFFGKKGHLNQLKQLCDTITLNFPTELDPKDCSMCLGWRDLTFKVM